MTRLRLTMVCEYDADPAHYDTSDPQEMANIDIANWQADPMMLWSCDDSQFTWIVEPAE